MGRSEAYYAFTLYFYPKISYGLPVSTFTEQECRHIQAPAKAAFLSKIGLNRHTAASIIHGPEDYGGLQLPNVYVDQGIVQLRLFLGHMRRQDKTSQLLEIAMSYMQLRTGAGTLFMNLPFPKYAKWVEKTWLASLWQFLYLAKLKVSVPLPLPSLLREQDIFLMTEFIYLGFEPSSLDLINQCRLYHQVVTLSDVATADGETIDSRYLESKRNSDRVSSLRWPNQGKPSPEAWRQWRRALLYLQADGKLRYPLGEWVGRPHQKWSWMFRVDDRRLYFVQGDTWYHYRPLSTVGSTRESQRPWYSKDNERRCLAPVGPLAVASPSSSQMDGTLFTVLYSGNLPERSTRLTPYHSSCSSASSSSSESREATELLYCPTFLQYISGTTFYRRLVGPIIPPSEQDLLSLRNHLESGNLLACSDGSFSRSGGTGSHAWVFSTNVGKILFSGAGPIDCHPDLLSSYRPEVGGLVGVLYILYSVVCTFSIAKGAVTIYCDNKSALENVFDTNLKRGIYPLLAVDYDLLQVARELRSKLPIKVSSQWVKGHYTGEHRQVQHDLNALVDFMADQFRRNPPPGYEPSARPYPTPSDRALVYSGGSSITSKLRQVVYSNFFSAPLQATIMKRNQWGESQFQAVDWRAFGLAFHTFSKFKQIGITKMVHRLWHTGAQKRLFQLEEEGLCPCCQACLETTAHVFKCQASQVVKFRETKLHQFDTYLASQEFSRSLKENLSAGIRQWTSSLEERPNLTSPTRGRVAPLEQVATKAFTEQSRLGWEVLLTGQLSVYWRQALLFGSSTGDEDAVEDILRQLIKKLFLLSLSLWDFRNGVLHGETFLMQRAKKSALIRQKVIEAYDFYSRSPNIVLPQDQYLFKRKELAIRLNGDDDALLCWLRTVEVAMTVMDRQQAQARANAEKFFAPFRAAGQRKHLNRAVETSEIYSRLKEQDSSPRSSRSEAMRLWSSESEAVQLAEEVSPHTRANYRSRRSRLLSLDGVTGTVLEDLLGGDHPVQEDSGAGSVSSGSSVVSPSHFFRPIIHQDISSDSSSYCPSKQRDIAFHYDTESSGTQSVRSFSSIRREVFFRRAEEVEQRLDRGILGGSPSHQSTSTSTDTGGSPTLVLAHSRLLPVSSSRQEAPDRPSEVVAMQRFLAQRQKGQHIRQSGVALGVPLIPAVLDGIGHFTSASSVRKGIFAATGVTSHYRVCASSSSWVTGFSAGASVSSSIFWLG